MVPDIDDQSDEGNQSQTEMPAVPDSEKTTDWIQKLTPPSTSQVDTSGALIDTLTYVIENLSSLLGTKH